MGSGRNVVAFSVANDKLYNDKQFDVLVKSDKDVNITFGEEMQKTVSITLNKEEWYSVSDILKQKVYNYDEVFSKVYIIQSQDVVKLYFKAIVGNASNKQNTLSNQADCSEVFELETVKSNKD